MAQTFGDRWEIVRSLGEGGQGHTYLVKDLRGASEIHYVLKRLKNPHRLDRFKREIEVIRNMPHENIVQLIDFDIDATKPYLVMEHCEGGSLTDAAPFWHESPQAALRLFLQICVGVQCAHGHDIVHRDIKPANIFLRTAIGPAVIGDFGICYVDEDGTRLTHTDEAVGARWFMAPEGESGRLETIDKRSDIYSLGKLLYWLLSKGRRLSREQYRDPSFDLKGRNDDTLLGWNNTSMEHVNRLLDDMIVVNPAQRRDISNIITRTRTVLRVVERAYNPVDPAIAQLCMYCGQGVYRSQGHHTTDIHNFGLNAVGNPNWRILVCGECGHVQLFRVDMAMRQEWWREE